MLVREPSAAFLPNVTLLQIFAKAPISLTSFKCQLTCPHLMPKASGRLHRLVATPIEFKCIRCVQQSHRLSTERFPMAQHIGIGHRIYFHVHVSSRSSAQLQLCFHARESAFAFLHSGMCSEPSSTENPALKTGAAGE